MKSVTTLTALLIGLLFVMGAYSQPQMENQRTTQVTDQTDKNKQLTDDLTTYINAVNQAMKSWSIIVQKTEELKNAKTTMEYVSKLRTEFVPIVTGVLILMEAIKPATKEVEDIHNAFKSSMKDYLSGLQGMADAVENNDDDLVNTSAEKLNAFAPAYAKLRLETYDLANMNNAKIK